MQIEGKSESVVGQSAVVALALDTWKLSRIAVRLLARIEQDDARRHVNQIRYILKSVEDTLTSAGLRIVALDGQPYDPGMAVTALNAADFDANDALVVEQTVEPIFMGVEGVVRPGTVVLAKVLTT